jgi:putative folate metabolism gamma-glutamate ligase
MIVKTIKTRVFEPPKDDLPSFIKEALSQVKLKEKSIIVITSKIVSIGEGRCIKIDSVQDKDELIRKEADYYLPRELSPGGHVMLTMKNNILIPTAGIDESNGKGYYILWPKNPYQSTERIYNLIKEEFKLKEFGVIISDSHCVPLRWGVTGIAMAYYGFLPLKDYRQTEDIFGRMLEITQVNIVDGLSSAAVLMMGEGAEQTPIAIIEDIDFIQFKEFDPQKENPLLIDKDKDIYAPLIKGVDWKSGP